VLEGIEEKIRTLERLADPAARESARALLQDLLGFTGEALGRMLEWVEKEFGRDALARLAADPKVGALLLLHGCHPTDLRTRVTQALESVRPYLQSHGGNVELLGIEEGRVRLRLEGSCQGCPSSAETLKTSIEEAIIAAAPDAAGVEVA